MAAHGLQVLRQPFDAFLDAPAVGFQLRFAFAAAHADAAALPGEVAPKAGQARQQMLQLRQFDLQFAFPRARPLRENIQNQRGAVQHLAAEDIFQIPALRR